MHTLIQPPKQIRFHWVPFLMIVLCIYVNVCNDLFFCPFYRASHLCGFCFRSLVNQIWRSYTYLVSSSLCSRHTKWVYIFNIFSSVIYRAVQCKCFVYFWMLYNECFLLYLDAMNDIIIIIIIILLLNQSLQWRFVFPASFLQSLWDVSLIIWLSSFCACILQFANLNVIEIRVLSLFEEFYNVKTFVIRSETFQKCFKIVHKSFYFNKALIIKPVFLTIKSVNGS